MMETREILKPVVAGALLGLLALDAPARTWTSADGSKTFEAEFVEFKGGKVTVQREGGKQSTFAIDFLSADDKAWVKKTAALQAEAAELAGAEIPKTIDGKLVKLEGKRFKKFEPQAPSKYYLLYFSASW